MNVLVASVYFEQCRSTFASSNLRKFFIIQREDPLIDNKRYESSIFRTVTVTDFHHKRKGMIRLRHISIRDSYKILIRILFLNFEMDDSIDDYTYSAIPRIYKYSKHAVAVHNNKNKSHWHAWCVLRTQLRFFLLLNKAIENSILSISYTVNVKGDRERERVTLKAVYREGIPVSLGAWSHLIDTRARARASERPPSKCVHRESPSVHQHHRQRFLTRSIYYTIYALCIHGRSQTLKQTYNVCIDLCAIWLFKTIMRAFYLFEFFCRPVKLYWIINNFLLSFENILKLMFMIRSFV